MQVETDLLNHVRNIRVSECQVRQSAGQLAIMRRVVDRIVCVTIELQQGVDWSGARFGVNHGCSLNNLHRVLMLTQEYAGRLMLDGDSQEVVKLPRSFMYNSHCKAKAVRCNNSVLEAVRTISSRYCNR
jgi:hypothetical protein